MNPAALQEYLLGRQAWFRQTEKGFDEASIISTEPKKSIPILLSPGPELQMPIGAQPTLIFPRSKQGKSESGGAASPGTG